MLKKRIIIEQDGFQINPEKEDAGRRAYYTTFSLGSTDVDKSSPKAVQYWDSVNQYTQRKLSRSFVCVWEEKDGKQVDECRFYIGGGENKPRIRWSIESAPRYGENAYMIRLRWVNHQTDKIHKSHIWLKNQENERKFSFLCECIEPLGGTEEAQYIIDVLPGTAGVSRLMIEGDELLLQKYILERKG